jgi:NADH:ubiquinone oxidoreductase subunit 4 (subunit M)
VFFGEFDEEKFPEVSTSPLKVQDRVALVILSAWLIILGVYPKIMTDTVESAVEPVVGLLKHASGLQ